MKKLLIEMKNDLVEFVQMCVKEFKEMDWFSSSYPSETKAQKRSTDGMSGISYDDRTDITKSYLANNIYHHHE